MKPSFAFITIILILLTMPGCERHPKQTVLSTGSTPAPETLIPAATASLRPASAPAGQTTPTQNPVSPVWVSNPTDHTVLRIDPSTNQVTAAIPLKGEPETVIAGEGAVWALDRRNNRVFRIDPAANRLVTSIDLPKGSAEALAVGNGFVWVGMTGPVDLNAQAPGPEEDVIPPGFVVQINPQTNSLLEKFPVQPVSRLAMNGSALWILSRTVIETPLQVIDLNSKQGMAMPFHNAPEWFTAEAMAINANTLWLFSSAYGKIFRASLDGRVNSAIDLEGNQPTGYADLLLAPSGLWAATPWGTILKIDPVTNHIQAQIELNIPLTRLNRCGWLDMGA